MLNCWNFSVSRCDTAQLNRAGEPPLNESQTSAALNDSQKTLLYSPGTRVQVTQQIAQRSHVYPISVIGTVLRQERQESGSWFARNKGNRLWLDRLIIQKDDGEKVVLNLDEFSAIKVLEGPQGADGISPMVLPNRDRAGSLT
jgi:hypothetical protein